MITKASLQSKHDIIEEEYDCARKKLDLMSPMSLDFQQLITECRWLQGKRNMLEELILEA